MKYVVVYTQHPSPSEERLLRQALGPDVVWESVLPLVSAPLTTDQQLKPAIDALQKLKNSRYKGCMEFMVQPDECLIPAVSKEDAIRALYSSMEWHKFRSETGPALGRLVIDVKEHPRCWVMAAYVRDGGMPPGVGFILDKFSMAVMPRRLIDVFGLDRTLL